MNLKVVDEKRFARGGRSLGQLLVAGQHVDEARLADIGASDEGVLRTVVCRALADECAALDVVGVFDFHVLAMKGRFLKIIVKTKREPFLEHPIGAVMLFAGFIFDRAVVEAGINEQFSGDVLVDGEFKKELNDNNLKWVGSSNQKIVDVQKSLHEGQVVLHCIP